jgi:hypothetical protein
VTVDLGVFTAAELRAGGINSRGFLQPLLPLPQGVDDGPANREAAAGLASRGLLRRGPSGWRAVGRYERVLEAAAVARSLVGIWGAAIAAGDTGRPTARLALGGLGVTPWVLDLCPESPGYRARFLEMPAATAELAGYVSGLTEQASGLPGRGPGRRGGPTGEEAAGGHPGDGAPEPVLPAAPAPALPEMGGKPPYSDVDSEWDVVELRLKGGVAAVRIEAASIAQPAGPLLQRRLTVVSADDGDWLLIGTREGERAERRAAPMAAVPMGPTLEILLRGSALGL